MNSSGSMSRNLQNIDNKREIKPQQIINYEGPVNNIININLNSNLSICIKIFFISIGNDFKNLKWDSS